MASANVPMTLLNNYSKGMSKFLHSDISNQEWYSYFTLAIMKYAMKSWVTDLR